MVSLLAFNQLHAANFGHSLDQNKRFHPNPSNRRNPLIHKTIRPIFSCKHLDQSKHHPPLKLTVFFSIALAGTLLIAKDIVASFYSTNPVIVSTASSLLVWVAIYHLADCIQAVCAFLLRCYRITIAPLVLYSVLLWGFGLYGGYLLTYEGLPSLAAMPSPITFWIASSSALWLVAGCFLLLLWRATHKNHSTIAQAV